MSGLAELLVRRGTGQRLGPGGQCHYPAPGGAGGPVPPGPRPEHLGDADIVVHSTAVKEDNPELAAARARGLTVLRRGEMLARLMHGHFQIAITGAHGKTSTTAMTAAILRAGGLDPTVVVGALLGEPGVQRGPGPGGLFRGRSRRKRRLLCLYRPQITVITNLDREHLDFYRDLAHIKETFAAYLRELPRGPGGGLGRRPAPGPAA